MSRYATIITDADGQEIVSAIGEFEGAAPQPRLGRVEQVAPGVKIGMVRDAAGGFCFPQAGIAGPLGLFMARLKARAGAAKPVGAANPAQVTGPKRAKKAKRKTVRSKKRASRPGPAAPKAEMVSAAGASAMDQVHD
ncbi:hypothetical protein EN978_20250 [Mesorhizobium sp. M7A.F.Ca.US.001.04.1.1]|uniref:hypothetical protein n=1 Tax=unclassified Mesorhizobium TaxID=325217 RepID=UPI000FCC4890|nr:MULTISPECIES: hypothetical protein [unclassified Mesorhizobium]RUY30033.1 hypothetical protein EN979_08165 [Mesorhizobium sp. M7A.F.Ca.US.001.04.2.1]RUY39827.1 hypothetical protein EN978_20250 [Mesorhizobium sp. M7A.F.Ca.US.001.04.1.1]